MSEPEASGRSYANQSVITGKEKKLRVSVLQIHSGFHSICHGLKFGW